MNDKIKCPNCGHKFDVEDALSGELEAHFKAEYEKKITEQAEYFNAKKIKLDEQKQELKAQKDQQDEQLKTQLVKQLTQATLKIEKAANESVAQRMDALIAENAQRKAENKDLKIKEVSLLKNQAQLKEQQEDFDLQMQKELLKSQSKIEEKIRLKEKDKYELKLKEKDKQLQDQKKLTEEMSRKQEQGSIQLQGEVQELALEDLLAKTYPFDQITEVPKGVRGADSIQTVVNSNQQQCGSIVYESKRTKSFANSWVDKLKQDQITCKADIAVLVTQALPNDMQRFGEKDGVWVCRFQEVKSLSFVLREMLIKINSTKLAQENKGDKMELLYGYLTSNEFVQNIQRMVENYDGMINQLNSEKKSMMKIWAIREKQIWVVQENVATLFGSIKGIAGNTLETADILQLPDSKID